MSGVDSIDKYSQMMRWLTRPKSQVQEPRNMDQAALSDDVVPGRLKDELAGNFDPSQETYEEYLQRINLERPFNMAEGGQLVKPSVDGSRPGYAKEDKFIRTEGSGKQKSEEMIKFLNYATKNKDTIKDKTITEIIEASGAKVDKSNARKRLKENKIEIGTADQSKVIKGVKSKTEKPVFNGINNFAKNWINKNQKKYGVTEYDKFISDFANDWNKELNKPLYKNYTGERILSNPDGTPKTNTLFGKQETGFTINDLKPPGERTSGLFYKRVFYKNKLKNKDFKKKVNNYLDWVLQDKRGKGDLGLGSGGKSNYLKAAQKFGLDIDKDVLYFFGEVMQGDLLTASEGFYSIVDKEIGGNKATKYRNKLNMSYQNWINNIEEVSKLAGVDSKVIINNQLKEAKKMTELFGLEKLPFEFRYAQDHLLGLAEAKALGDPKIARQTLTNLVASTKEQNTFLGTKGFSAKRTALMRKFKNALPEEKINIINQLNTLAEDYVPGRLKYSLTKDDALRVTNLQPEKTFKARTAAYEKITKTLPKNVQKLFTNSMQADLSPRSIAQLSKIHGCGKKQEGGSIMSCLQGKFKADPEKFLQKSAPLAKDNMNLFKWFKNGRKIARGTGIALAWEAAFAPIIAGWGALEGQSGQRILNDIAYGIPFIGETEKEEWMKYAGDDELAYKMKQMGELEEQELPYLDQQLEKARKQSAPTREKMPNYVSPKEQYILDDIKEKELKLQGLYNTPEFWEGPAGSYYNESAIQKAYALEQQTTAKIAADTAERKKATFDWLEKNKIYDPNWHSQSSYAGGGIASIRRPNAIPPKSGPTPQGLPSMYNRVKRI